VTENLFALSFDVPVNCVTVKSIGIVLRSLIIILIWLRLQFVNVYAPISLNKILKF
jgi:hypothetical protein